MPNNFPAPFPDDDNDKIVDDAEFMPIVNSAEGSITGGIVHGVPHGSTYAETGLPSSSNSAATDMESGHYDGNLVLVGTEANPIVLDGKVTVSGDVMIGDHKLKAATPLLLENFDTGDPHLAAVVRKALCDVWRSDSQRVAFESKAEWERFWAKRRSEVGEPMLATTLRPFVEPGRVFEDE